MDREENTPAGNQKDIPTEYLLNEIKAASKIDKFMEKNKKVFYSRTVSEHFNMLLKKYCVNKNEAIQRADIERGYGYQILRGVRDAKRDKYIRLAIGIGLDLDDTQRLLTIAKHGVLYPKIERDAVLIFCVSHHLDIMKAQDLLYDNGFKLLE